MVNISICSSFSCIPTGDNKGVFLDISKTSHEALLNLHSYEIEGSPLRFLKNYVTVRQQRVVLSGCSSSWHNVTADVLQGSILGLLLFIYINDFSDEIASSCKFLQATHHF